MSQFVVETDCGPDGRCLICHETVGHLHHMGYHGISQVEKVTDELCEDEGCDHYGTPHVCRTSPTTVYVVVDHTGCVYKTEDEELAIKNAQRVRDEMLPMPMVASMIDAAWQYACELGDRTSPEDYPNHALLTREELGVALEKALSVHLHSDDVAVAAFAAVMSAKLEQKRKEGYAEWEDKELCPQNYLSQCLRDHVEKGDPVDVANLAMMLHQRGEEIL